MNASDILNVASPLELFSKQGFKLEYRKLASKWHPDKGGDPKVFAHIKKLYEKMDAVVSGGEVITLRSSDGVDHVFLPIKAGTFELGEVLICSDSIVYKTTWDNADLHKAFIENAKAITFRNRSSRPGVAGPDFMPGTLIVFEGEDFGVIQINRPDNALRLYDVLSHMGTVPERHVAWIVSRLLNLCCYLECIGMSHNAISTENVYIDPAQHTAYLLGGWFYAKDIGGTLIAVPKKTLDYAPHDLIRAKKGSIRTDLEMVKATARELLGDISGARLYKTSAPKAFVDWLRAPCGDDAVKEFTYYYNTVLTEAFGPKKFVELKLSIFDIY